MKSILLIACILFTCCANAQLKQLQEVQSARLMANDYEQRMLWDSACYAYQRVVEHSKYANPYDQLEFSYCSLKRGDTVLFAKYLGNAIAAGIDTGTISGFFSRVIAREKDRLQLFVKGNFERLHQTYLSTYDTGAIDALSCIAEMDQMGRTPLMKLLARNGHNWKDANIHYYTVIQQVADSINYSRVVRLMESGRFPGYRRCGAATSGLVQAMFHFDGKYADWDYIFRKLKQAVLDGDIDPNQVASIADRHYLGLPTPVYYYGRLKWSEQYAFFDCRNVDRFRAEIGIETLAAEYQKRKRALPECYRTR